MILNVNGIWYIFYATSYAILITWTNRSFDSLIANRMKDFPSYAISPMNGLLDAFCHFLFASSLWTVSNFLAYQPSIPNYLSFLKTNIPLAILSGILSILVDVDHFIAAGSFSLEAATSLSERPFLHNSILPLVLVTLLIYLHVNGIDRLLVFNLIGMSTVALVTQHIRDAARRGLMFRFFSYQYHSPPLLFIHQTVITTLFTLLMGHLLFFNSPAHELKEFDKLNIP